MNMSRRVLIVALFFASGVLANWAPSCANWNDCMQVWDVSGCQTSTGWQCLCNNATQLSQVNTCVATSCTDHDDQQAIYGAIAQLCADNGATVTNSAEATFSATSGGSLLATITGSPGSPGFGPNGAWKSGDWAGWVSKCSSAVGNAPSGWNGQGSWGSGWRGDGNSNGNWNGPGNGNWNSDNGNNGWNGGPWGTKASGVDCAAWTTWTAGWGPFSSWTGTWSGCSTATVSPEPATVTMTITSNGQISVITGTTFGIQAAAVSTDSSGTTNNDGITNAATTAADQKLLVTCGCAVVAVFMLMLAL